MCAPTLAPAASSDNLGEVGNGLSINLRGRDELQAQEGRRDS